MRWGFGVETSGAVEKRDAVSIFNWLWQMIAGQDGMAELPRMQSRRIQERRARRIIGVEQAANARIIERHVARFMRQYQVRPRVQDLAGIAVKPILPFAGVQERAVDAQLNSQVIVQLAAAAMRLPQIIDIVVGIEAEQKVIGRDFATQFRDISLPAAESCRASRACRNNGFPDSRETPKCAPSSHHRTQKATVTGN